MLDYPKHNIRMVVETEYEKRMRLTAAAKEPETVQWIDQHVQKGDVFYDIGANVGSYSFIAASRGARVYAFEPEALNFARLVQNCSLNLDLDITPLPLAIAEKCCTKRLYLSHAQPGAAGHRLEAPEPKPNGSVASQVITCVTLAVLDSFHIPEPNHLKIDVDGYELQVLHGAEYMLGWPAVRSVMIEVRHNLPGNVERIMEHMKSADLVEAGSWHRSAQDFNHLFVRR